MFVWQAVQAVAGLVVAAVQAVIEQTQHLQLVQVVH
jgi:heme exporter protein D